MSSVSLPFDSATGAGPADTRLRGALFLAAFLFLWLTLTPFPDLSEMNLLEEIGDGNLLNQVSVTLTMLVLGGFALRLAPQRLASLVTLPLVLMLAWFAFSALVSPTPDLTLRRFVLGAFTIVNAAALVILPKDRTQLAWLLFIGGMLVLALSYAGVALLPDRAIHQVGDMLDDTLAGDWRGALEHKNRAGGAMVILIFAGLYVMQVAHRGAGLLLTGLAAVFLAFTHAKSSIMLLPVTLIAAFVVARARGVVPVLLLAVAVPFLINLATVGSVMSDAVRDGLSLVMPDPTYTNRADLWRLALRYLGDRPLAGYGFGGFWQTSFLLAQADLNETWAYMGPDAHNGYLNTALLTGVVGLALALVWLIGRPIRDVVATAGSDDPLRLFMIRCWLFGLYLSGFESIFFGNGNCIWLMLLMAVIGLRFMGDDARAAAAGGTP